MDVSEYLINAFNEIFGNGEYSTYEDEDGSMVLSVKLIGLEEFEFDLKDVEIALLELDYPIDINDYVMSAVEAVSLSGDYNIEMKNYTFKDVADVMEMILSAITEIGLPYEISDPIESEEDPSISSGYWINIGQYPVPFYFEDALMNLIAAKRPADLYVKEIIVQHVGRIPRL